MRGYLSFEYEEFEVKVGNEIVTSDTIDLIASVTPGLKFNYYVIDDSGKIIYQGVIPDDEEKRS